MKYKIRIKIPDTKGIEIELDDTNSPKTAKEFVEHLPFDVGLNLWGDEIYTDESPLNMKEENAKSIVDLNDVAYWPTGKALCLFFGPTPIGNKDEIKPYSPVNVVGKIVNPEKKILTKVEGKMGSFDFSMI